MNETSIIEMVKGGVIERIDMAMGEVLANIHDLNTPATKPRTISVKVILKPNDQRNKIPVTYDVECRLAPKSSLVTTLTTGITADGEIWAIEDTPNIPGQMALNGKEQEPPKVLKFG